MNWTIKISCPFSSAGIITVFDLPNTIPTDLSTSSSVPTNCIIVMTVTSLGTACSYLYRRNLPLLRNFTSRWYFIGGEEALYIFGCRFETLTSPYFCKRKLHLKLLLVVKSKLFFLFFFKNNMISYWVYKCYQSYKISKVYGVGTAD